MGLNQAQSISLLLKNNSLGILLHWYLLILLFLGRWTHVFDVCESIDEKQGN